MVRIALSFLGTPYRLGGADPATGFDCSGYVRYVLAQFSIDLPRTVAEQYQVGQDIAIKNLRPGDLVFFKTNGSTVSHVGFSIGSGPTAEFVHAPISGGVVRIEHLDSGYWSARLVGVKRMN